MQYLVLKETKTSWKPICIVKSKPGQKNALRILEDKYKNLSGLYWIMPLKHSNLYTYKKGKLILKENFYNK